MPVSRFVLVLLAFPLLSACEPTVRVEAPKDPITINLNVKIDAEVRVKLEQQAEKDIRNAPEIVITSYSIHYTKLYERSAGVACQSARSRIVDRKVCRITSYNVCYTKLLR